MPLIQTSIYTFLSAQNRIDLFAGNEIFSQLHDLLQLSPSLFKVCELESWWAADNEKKYEYQFLDKSKKLWTDVGTEAIGLASAAYNFKNQPELIRDFATLFVAKNACKMAEVFICETAEEIFEARDEDMAKNMPIFLRNELPVGMPWNPSEQIEFHCSEDVADHINTKFGKWGQDFLLDLLRWKKPKADVECDADDDSKSDDSTGVPPSGFDIPTP